MVTPSHALAIHPEDASTTDGRLARGRRTRRQLAEAMINLLESGNLRPTASKIAATAGVSLRLVFHHFTDVEALFAAAAALQEERHWKSITPLLTSQPVDLRVNELVDQLARLHDAVAPVRRAAMLVEDSSPIASDGIARGRRALRNHIERGFGPELEKLPAPESQQLLDILDVCASWESWEHLRNHLGQSRVSARAIVVRMITSQLEFIRRPAHGAESPVSVQARRKARR